MLNNIRVPGVIGEYWTSAVAGESIRPAERLGAGGRELYLHRQAR